MKKIIISLFVILIVSCSSQESLDGYMPSDPYNKPTPDGNSTLIGRGTSEPFSGEPFNCEIWDSQRYIDFVKSDEQGFDILLTDRDESRQVDDDERFGCPVDMKFVSTFSFIFLNFLLLIISFYIYNKLSNTAIIMPVLGFAIIETLLFAIYGGLLNKVIFALPLTFGLVCTVGLIVAGGVLLIRTSLGRPLDDPPTLTFYIFIIAAENFLMIRKFQNM